MVFQNYESLSHMTVYQNVSYGLKIKRIPKSEARSRTEAMLETVGVGGLGIGGRASCPAVSSSGSRWRGRWSTSRRRLPSTSRSAPWTRSSGSGCSSS